MSVSMLRNRVLEYQGQRSRTTQGRKCDITPEVVEHIADSVKKMSELGFGPTIHEFQDLVGEYVTLKKLKTQFKDNIPGYEWTNSFLKRHCLKKGGQMQLARKNVTSDPFVVYGFYEMLDKEVNRLGIADKPECFYNCDESGFPTDPSRCKYIGAVRQKTVQVTHGSNRENTTVL